MGGDRKKPARSQEEARKRPARGQEQARKTPERCRKRPQMGGTPRNTETIEKPAIFMKRIH